MTCFPTPTAILISCLFAKTCLPWIFKIIKGNGTLSPQLLEDPEQVDERRAALGMEPMAEAMSEMASRRCRKK